MRVGPRQKVDKFKPEVRNLMCELFKRFCTDQYGYLKIFYIMEFATNQEMVFSTMKEF